MRAAKFTNQIFIKRLVTVDFECFCLCLLFGVKLVFKLNVFKNSVMFTKQVYLKKCEKWRLK
jgi:hypothetical protein